MTKSEMEQRITRAILLAMEHPENPETRRRVEEAAASLAPLAAVELEDREDRIGQYYPLISPATERLLVRDRAARAAELNGILLDEAIKAGLSPQAQEIPAPDREHATDGSPWWWGLEREERSRNLVLNEVLWSASDFPRMIDYEIRADGSCWERYHPGDWLVSTEPAMLELARRLLAEQEIQQQPEESAPLT